MTGVSVSLTLNDEEKELVQEALEVQHRTLLRELSHADQTSACLARLYP